MRLASLSVVAGYADLVRLAHVSRARVSQIMSLLLLAPALSRRSRPFALTLNGPT